MRCTYNLWFVADPTDGTATSTEYSTENWLASVQVSDDNFATSTLTETQTGNEMTSFLSFNVSTATIPYGSLEPGQDTGTLNVTTTIQATGNVGLDESLYGDDMCPTFPTCFGAATNTIAIANQEFATSSLAYGSGTDLTASTSPSELEINVNKTVATATLATGDTLWGIAVPGTITLAGDYTGQNTILGIVGESSDW